MSAKGEVMTREEVLILLSEKARGGSIGALIALERALRIGGEADSDIDDELERLLK